MNDVTCHPSEVFGATLLIAGSCIGAGMLALPVVTGLAGFVPAVVVFLIGWVFMTVTGLLLLEINLWLGGQISIVSMAGRTLGTTGKVLAWGLFCFLFYLILIAYTAACGSLVADFFQRVFNVPLPHWVGSLLCTVAFGLLVYAGTRPVDLVNRLFMLGLIVSYVLLLALGAEHVRGSLLTHIAWLYAIPPIPIVVIAFGFHNMVPSLTHYLKRNHLMLQLAIIAGTTITLFVYLAWEWLILGIVPATGEGSFEQSVEQGDMATHALLQAVGISWVTAVAQWFAFFAIVTSFLAQALSLVHFLADGFRVPLNRLWSAFLTLIAVGPPFIAAVLDPTIFIRALEMAGAYSAVILFGVLPATMVWVGRYRQHGIRHQLIPGGRPVLALVIIFSLTVMTLQILHQAEVLM
jgi:tyrosine-specific transport protein